MRPGHNDSADKRFHAELLALYDHCAKFGFRPNLLRRAVVLNGGVKAAKALVFQPGTTGLERLLDIGKPELSMEAMMLRPEFRTLFTAAEIKEASERLASRTRSRSRGRLTNSATIS